MQMQHMQMRMNFPLKHDIYSLFRTFFKDKLRALSSIWGGAFWESSSWLKAVESCYRKKGHLGHVTGFQARP